MRMTEADGALRAKALAAASAARLAGFVEVATALIDLANRSDGQSALRDGTAKHQDAMAWYLEKIPTTA